MAEVNTREQIADKHATFLRRYLLRIGCEVARTSDEIGIFDTILFLESLSDKGDEQQRTPNL